MHSPLTSRVNLQVSFLKEVIVRKDEDIERLRLTKVNGSSQKGGMSTIRGRPSSPSSPRRKSIEPRGHIQTISGVKSLGHPKRVVSDLDNCSESSDKHSEAGSQALNAIDDVDLLGFGNADSERLSDISDGGLSIEAETDGSVEYTLFPELAKPVETESSQK